MNRARIKKLMEVCAAHQLDAFLITHPISLRYIVGFTGSNGLSIITAKSVYFITDFRYKEQASIEVYADVILQAKDSLVEGLKTFLGNNHLKNVGIEAEHITLHLFEQLKEAVTPAQLVPLVDVINTIAAVKSSEEIENIRCACDITRAVFTDICHLLQTGAIERDIAAEISYRIKKSGGDCDAFEPVVLFGSNSAFPHRKPGNTRLNQGDIIQLDFGAVYKGYCADFSRVLFMGEPSQKMSEMHRIVQEAQKRAITVCKPGVPANEIDAAARAVIEQAGYGAYLGHAVGHGIGLDVHMLPKISPLHTAPIVPGNVFTIEPGVYFPGIGGIRIEDVAYMSNTGVNVLTNTSQDSIVL